MSNAVVTDWPSGSANTGWPQEPSAMLMPGRVQGWPAGTQRAANAAERLLSQAVAYWDVGQYRDGDRFLRNRGTGGELLDLRLGSSIVANSNDPLYLEPMSTGYVYVPGSNSNALTVPDENALDLQDIEIVFRVSMDDWTPAANTVLMSKGSAVAASNYRVQVNSSGTIAFIVADGTTYYTAASANPGLADGQTYWVKITRVASTGLCDFYWAGDSVSEPTTWTTISTGVSSGYTGTVTSNAVAVAFGGVTATSSTFAGRLHRLIIRSSVGGSTVLDIDCDAITSGSATSFTAATGQTVTISRATSGRKSVAMPSRSNGGRPVMSLGTDDFLEVTDNWQHGLLNFAQGDSFTVLAVVRQWATIAAGSIFVAKKTTANALSSGYVLSAGSTSAAQGQLRLSDVGSNQVLPVTGSRSDGALAVVTGLRDAVTRAATAYLGETPGTAIRDQLLGSSMNTDNLRVGRLSGSGTGYADMEFYGAAVFRRALSPAEITTLSNYFTGRIA